MTISSAAVQGIHSAESLLDRTATNVANQTGASPLTGDEVSLSSDAIALMQAGNEVATDVRLIHADTTMQNELLNIMA
jgi:hypothetical protein